MEKMRALFLSASFGGGHQNASLALQEALAIEGHDRDYLGYIPWWEKLPVLGIYAFSLRYWPGFYRWFYHWTNRPSEPRIITDRFATSGAEGLMRDLKRLRPQVVISSYPTAAALVGHVRKNLGGDFANVLVLTDLRAHRHWARPEADLILASSEEARLDLLNHGIDEHRVVATGIPVRRIFSNLPAKEALRAKLGLDERPVVIIASGATDAYRAKSQVLRALFETNIPCQVVAFQNRTRPETRELEKSTLHLLPTGPDFPHYLGAADLVLGKAGGLTVAEALTVGRPYLVYEPIPGHEEENARWLVAKGAGIWARDKRSLARALRALLTDPPYRQSLAERARALGRPRAAADAAERIRALLEVRV